MHKANGTWVAVLLALTLSGCPSDDEKSSAAADGGEKTTDDGGEAQDAGSIPEDSGTPADKDAGSAAEDSGSQQDPDSGSTDIETPAEGVTLTLDGELVESLHPQHGLLNGGLLAKRIIYNHTEYQIKADDYTLSLDIAFEEGSMPPYQGDQVTTSGTSLSIILNDESNFDPPPAIRSTNVRKTFKPTGVPVFAFADAPGRFAGVIEGEFAAEEDGETHDAKITFNFPLE